MANICTASVYFYTDKNTDDLEKMHNDFEIFLKYDSEKSLNTFCQHVLDMEDLGFSTNRGDLSDVDGITWINGYSALLVEFNFAWSPSYAAINALAQKYGVSWCSSADEAGYCSFDVVGDENAAFFESEYMTDIWDKDLFIDGKDMHEVGSQFFKDKAGLTAFLNSLNTDFVPNESDPVSSWNDYLYEELGIGKIVTFNRKSVSDVI